MTINTRTDANNSSTPSTRWRRRIGWAVLSIGILATVIAVRHYQGTPPASAEAPGQRTARPNAKTSQSPARRAGMVNRKMPDPVAVVNGHDIRPTRFAIGGSQALWQRSAREYCQQTFDCTPLQKNVVL